MRTVPHWTELWPLALASLAYFFGLAWWKTARRMVNVGECGQPPETYLYHQRTPLKRGPYRSALADFDATEEWCPAHEQWYGAETECSDCRDEWEQTRTLGEEPAQRGDDWSDSDDERWAATEIYQDKELSDGWYLDLLKRAEFPIDPHSDWRDA